ncbi:MAG TPA: Coq4 family protein [Myxococcota bacterium]|nr:Coq4 family protein [Myxococcota bacterium]
MEPSPHVYSPEPTRNPFRYARAVWRLVRRDPETTTDEAAIVELGFARSRFGRRFARWGETLAHLKGHPGTARALRERRAFGPIVLSELETLPEATLGRVFADHCRTRGINPNLVHVPPDDEVGWFLNHLYQTHDIWHVVTGWGNDLPGEVGQGAFYAAQLGAPPFFGYLSALVFLNVVSRRADLGEVFAAFSAGWRAGERCAPLFGVHWDELWAVPLTEVRARFAVDGTEIVGEGIPEAA